MIDHSKLRHIVKNIQNKKILVLGDIMLDQYIYGSVDRISPEAPIPIINIDNMINVYQYVIIFLN